MALLYAALGGGAVCCMALLCLWGGKPATRNAFKTRHQGRSGQTVFEMLCTFSWSGLVFCVLLAVMNPGARMGALIGGLVALAFALGTQVAGWMLRLR